MTQKWYQTFHHPEMHPQTKFGIYTLNNISDMMRIHYYLKLGQSSRSQRPENILTLCHVKMHLHIYLGIPISKNIVDMHQTQCSF